MITEQQINETILADVGHFHANPLGYVEYAFPWGRGELQGKQIRTWQREYLIRLGERIREKKTIGWEPIREAVCSGHGIGKAQGYSLVLDTPTGRRRWGDIVPGDLLFGPSGHVRVTHRHEQGVRPMYRVTFTDGSSTCVDELHVWSVRGRQQRRYGRDGWLSMTTRELMDRGVQRPNGAAMACQWEIPSYAPVEFMRSLPPNVDSYVLGVWLGDGCKGNGRITNADSEVWDEVGKHYECGKPNGITRTAYTLKRDLDTVGVMGLKTQTLTIPDVYRYAPSQDRLGLLQGLLDTDGWVEVCGQPSFGSTSKKLVEDVVWLARSLGLQARMRPNEKHPFYVKDGERIYCKPSWSAGITWDGVTRLFRLTRKQNAMTPAEERYRKRWIKSIEYSHHEQAMCVTVDSEDGLYLTNDFIVTHNSTLLAWLMLWSMSTFPDTRGVVTAGKKEQLKTKTWPELAKWYNLAINKDWFTLQSESLFSNAPGHERTWRFDMLSYTKESAQTVAGLHNEGKRLVLLFDESSMIPKPIWEVMGGALTDKDTEIYWLVYGNPTHNTGDFRECFGKLRHRWHDAKMQPAGPLMLDSRTVEGTNLKLFSEWVDDYGEDSDYVRVRVRGMFPRASSLQFIDSELVAEAMKRLERWNHDDALIVGLDIARGGDDNNVFTFRRGLDARSIPQIVVPGSETRDTTKLVDLATHLVEKHKPDVFFADATGVGGPVLDRLRQLGVNVVDVQFGATSPDPRYANYRAFMWGRMLELLRNGLAIESNYQLEQDLTGVEYMHNGKDQLLLEKKEHMKERGLASPDRGDSLAMCCLPFLKKGNAIPELWRRRMGQATALPDYDPHGGE